MDNIRDKFQSIYSTVRGERGPFYLFMILKMDELVDKWSVIVSAPWITRENQHESFQYMSRQITSVLTPEEISTIARLGIFLPDEHLIKLVNQSMRVQGGSSVKIENTKLNGYLIHEAYIYESTPPEIPANG